MGLVFDCCPMRIRAGYQLGTGTGTRSGYLALEGTRNAARCPRNAFEWIRREATPSLQVSRPRRRPKFEYFCCTPAKFDEAGIALPSPDIVRTNTDQARAFCRQLQHIVLGGLEQLRPQDVGRRTPTVADAIERYFDIYDRQTPDYRATLRRIFQRFQDVVGDRQVDTLVDDDLKSFERDLERDDLARESVRSYLRQLFMLIEFAWRKGWIKSDPRATYRMPPPDGKEPEPFSRDDLVRFFEITAAPQKYHPEGWDYMSWMGIGMLCLGLRPIELEWARWENVRWGSRFLVIDKSHAKKEAYACRPQPIPLVAMPMFEQRREESGFIWKSYFGRRVTPNVLSRSRASLKKSMPEFTWKKFRKTFASMTADAGNDIGVIRSLLRHSSGGNAGTVAERNYIGRSREMLRNVVDEVFVDLATLTPFRSAEVPSLNPWSDSENDLR